jgi:alcohol dehydrogenase class IV
MKIVTALMPFPLPELFAGPGSARTLPPTLKARGIDDVLVVTDKGLTSIGLVQGFCESMEANKITYTVFDEVQPNPTIQDVEKGLHVFSENACKAIVAFGGGSPMDCAKAIGARFSNPNRTVQQMKGMFKVRKKLPPLFAVPTTAGTGSETTVVAVITDSETHEKLPLIDLKLVPLMAVLDPELMLGLPPAITSATGMDALTHAIESYIGLHGTRYTEEKAEKATRIIFEDLEDLYKDGSDVEKRNNMAMASFYAGSAFTRASVGYVHAFAHQMGGLYGVPHGLANAIILPYILAFSREEAQQKMARLARAAGIGEGAATDEALSHRLIEQVKTMNRNMNIPTTIQELQEKDIPLIAERALKEGNPAYPVPRIMKREECEGLLRQLLC